MENLQSLKIKSELIEIFNNRFNIDFNKLEESYLSKDLLGKELLLSARDLLYIYFDVMNKFNITIPDEDVSQGKFSTFDGILEIILVQLKVKELSLY